MRFKLEKGGGLLLADACCGSAKFDESFHNFIDELFEKYGKGSRNAGRGYGNQRYAQAGGRR